MKEKTEMEFGISKSLWEIARWSYDIHDVSWLSHNVEYNIFFSHAKMMSRRLPERCTRMGIIENIKDNWVMKGH